MRVFLSYVEQDMVFARDLAGRLQEAGLEVAPIDSDVLPGDNVLLKLGRALERSDAMIVLVSPASAKSQRIQYEIMFALGSPRYHNRILPVIIRPTRQLPWVVRRMRTRIIGRDPAHVSRRIVSKLERMAESNN